MKVTRHSLWATMSLDLMVIPIEETLAVEILDTPRFWSSRNKLKYHVIRFVHGFGTNYC